MFTPRKYARNLGHIRRRHNPAVSSKPQEKPHKQMTNKTLNQPTSTCGRYHSVPGQCEKCAETNHVTSRHRNPVTCTACNQKGHKKKHHSRPNQ